MQDSLFYFSQDRDILFLMNILFSPPKDKHNLLLGSFHFYFDDVGLIPKLPLHFVVAFG